MRWLFVWAAQGCIFFALSGFIAFLLRFDLSASRATCSRYLVYALPIWIAVKSVIFQASNLNRWGLRYVSIADVYRIVIANCAGSFLSWAIIVGLAPAGFPRSIFISELVLSLLGTSGLRVAVRMISEAIHGGQGHGQEKRTLIYGAGDAGITLLREIRNNPKLAYRVCGFLDDGLDKKDLLISGIEVLGSGDEVKSLVTKHNIAIILIALPSAIGRRYDDPDTGVGVMPREWNIKPCRDWERWLKSAAWLARFAKLRSKISWVETRCASKSVAFAMCSKVRWFL